MLTAEDRRELVVTILHHAQKCRSNLIESFGSEETTLALFRDLNPVLFREDALNLVEVCARVLDGDREVTPGDLYNVLYLANQEPMIDVAMSLAEQSLPTPMEALQC